MNVPIEYKIEELERLQGSIDSKREGLRRELGHLLTALLELKGITQREAALIVGISHGSIAAMCNDRAHNKPSLRTALAVFREISTHIEE